MCSSLDTLSGVVQQQLKIWEQKGPEKELYPLVMNAVYKLVAWNYHPNSTTLAKLTTGMSIACRFIVSDEHHIRFIKVTG